MRRARSFVVEAHNDLEATEGDYVAIAERKTPVEGPATNRIAMFIKYRKEAQKINERHC